MDRLRTQRDAETALAGIVNFQFHDTVSENMITVSFTLRCSSLFRSDVYYSYYHRYYLCSLSAESHPDGSTHQHVNRHWTLDAFWLLLQCPLHPSLFIWSPIDVIVVSDGLTSKVLESLCSVADISVWVFSVVKETKKNWFSLLVLPKTHITFTWLRNHRSQCWNEGTLSPISHYHFHEKPLRW